MDFTVENICGFLIRSRLLNPEEVKSAYQRWLGDCRDGVGNVNQFSRWLVSNKYVTEYQAALLVKGHADDFFLNQYQILDRLGRGRMAGVYKAVHHLGQVVAIKVLPPSRARNPQFLARFQREARLAMRLKHPNVVRAFQLGEANGLQYLVMEYVEGETLDEVLQRRRKLPPAEAVRLIHQALLGLQHIHEQGMVHRDLKPANLMLSPAPARKEPETTLHSNIKILDIGLGRAFFEETEAVDSDLTGEGVLLGTPDYLAPEQARDPRAIDIRADIYSLGCVLYHALTGQPPFPDKSVMSQMLRHETETPRPLKEFNPAIPDGLQQIVGWMMAKKPDARYPTPGRAAQALEVFLAADAEPVRTGEEAPQMRKFLTWLETDNGAQTQAPLATPAVPADFAPPPNLAPPAPTPARAAAPPPPRAATVSSAAAPAREHKRKRRHERAAPSQPKPQADPVADAGVADPVAADLDVELVAVAPSTAPTAPGLWPLLRRDWIMLGIGAGSVILAGLLGMVLALIFGN
jgi:serine/threonine protein kinase